MHTRHRHTQTRPFNRSNAPGARAWCRTPCAHPRTPFSSPAQQPGYTRACPATRPSRGARTAPRTWINKYITLVCARESFMCLPARRAFSIPPFFSIYYTYTGCAQQSVYLRAALSRPACSRVRRPLCAQAAPPRPRCDSVMQRRSYTRARAVRGI